MSKTLRSFLIFITAASLALYGLSSFWVAESFTIADGMNATEVVAGSGGPTQSFTDGSFGTTSEDMYNASDVYLDEANNRLFVADTYNNRVLVYNLNASHEPLDYVADIVLGQPDFTSTGTATNATSMHEPIALAYDIDNDYLFVSDSDIDGSGGHSRILVFNADPGTLDTGDAAIRVLGEANFTANTQSSATSGLTYPWGIDFDNTNDRLFVADRNNARTMVWDLSGAITNGMPASWVLGQPDFLTGSTGEKTSTSTWATYGLFYESNNDWLFVNDALNQRTMIWDVSTITNGEAASWVLGQSDFTSGQTARTANATSSVTFAAGPNFVAINEYAFDPTTEELFMTDYYGHRMMVFDLSDGITNGEAATNILGQADFTSSGINRGAGFFAPTQSSLAYPLGMYFDSTNDNLYVGDAFNSRVLRFTTLVASSPTGSSGVNFVNPPQCNLSAPETIVNGEAFDLDWGVTWSGSLTSSFYYKLNGEMYPSNTEGVTIYPEDPLYPNQSQEYVLDAINIFGATVCTKTVSIEQVIVEEFSEEDEPEEIIEDTEEVDEIVIQPLECSLSASPSSQREGEPVSLSWDISGGYSPYLAYLNREGLPISQPHTYVSDNLPENVSVTILDDAGRQADCSAMISLIPEQIQLPPQDVVSDPVEVQPVPAVPVIPTDSVLIDDSPVMEDVVIEAEEVSVDEPKDVTFRTVDIANFLQEPGAKAGVVSALAIGLLTAIAGAFRGPMSASEIVLLPARLWNILLTALGVRKKDERKWGTVFNSKTKEPLDPVHVVLTNVTTGEQKTAITDMDGRYSFIVDQPGSYRLTANKNEYTFPSSVLRGQSDDHLYNSLYFGEVFEVAESGQVITKNIPLDPTTVNWNEQDKLSNNRMKFFKKRDYVIAKFADMLFYLGFFLAALALVFFPAPYNIAIFVMYVLFAVLRKTGYGGRSTGSVSDAEGNPIPHAILRLISPTLGQEIKHAVADKYGRYHLLANNGEYNLKVEQRSDQQVIKQSDQTAKITKGYYNKNIKI